MKTSDYAHVQGLPERPPLIILYKGRRLARALFEQNSIRFDFSSIQFDSISARARIVVRICVRFQLELELWLEFVSKFALAGIRIRIESKNCSKWLLELASIRLQKFRKQFEIELASIAKVLKTIRKIGKG